MFKLECLIYRYIFSLKWMYNNTCFEDVENVDAVGIIAYSVFFSAVLFICRVHLKLSVMNLTPRVIQY